MRQTEDKELKRVYRRYINHMRRAHPQEYAQYKDELEASYKLL